MRGIPSFCFASVSIDRVRDVIGEVPPVLSLGGNPVQTVFGNAGKGKRTYFSCPHCERRVLLLYFPLHGGPPKCRHCYAVAYVGQQLHQSKYEPIVLDVRSSRA